MQKERFAHLIAHAGPIAPEGVEKYIADLAPRAHSRLFDHSILEKVIADNGVPESHAAQLWQALDVIEADAELVELSQILCQDAVRSHNRCTACEFEAPVPECLSGFPQKAFAFLFALACVEEGRAALRRRGVPEKYDADIPERMIRKQLRKFMQTGDISFDDYVIYLARDYYKTYSAAQMEADWHDEFVGVEAEFAGDVNDYINMKTAEVRKDYDIVILMG